MYLGIDLGTSSVKALIINDQQQVIASASADLSLSNPQPLWSEQDPEQWWQATEQAIAGLHSSHRQALQQLRAISFSGQMHGATLLNHRGQVLRPAILWNDGRSVVECQQLVENEPLAEKITGNLIMPGFTAPKLLWLMNHHPQLFDQIGKVLLPKDYLRYRISGDFATDLSDASGSCWLDVGQRQWSLPMLTATGLDVSQMPSLFEGNQITGNILPQLANKWGVPTDVALVAGGGDNAASAVSMNVVESGSAFLSLGTSGVLFVADDQFRPNPSQAVHTFCHCLPQRWHQMTVHLSAAACLDWVAKLIGANDIGKLLKEVERHEDDDAPIFLPYLSGERTPHNDPYARGVFFGMTQKTNSLQLVQAVLEGVAFALAQGQAAMLSSGVKIDAISVVGGASRSHYWGEIISAALQQPLDYRQSSQLGGAYGAARLAWLAKQNQSVMSRGFDLPPLEHRIEPNPVRVECYRERQQLFNQLYQLLKPVFNQAYANQ